MFPSSQVCVSKSLVVGSSCGAEQLQMPLVHLLVLPGVYPKRHSLCYGGGSVLSSHLSACYLSFCKRNYVIVCSFQRSEEDETKRLLQLSKEVLSEGAGVDGLEQLDHDEEELILAEYESDEEKKTISG